MTTVVMWKEQYIRMQGKLRVYVILAIGNAQR